MVEASAQGDGIVRNVSYARFRTDIKADEGYSSELISDKDVHIKDWDAVLHENCELGPGQDTILKAFLDKVERYPTKNFLGSRR